MKSHRANGFTLVELLVVTAIILLLLVLIPVAINTTSRTGGYKSSCANNQRQIALALASYESSHGHYPGYWNEVGPATAPNAAASTTVSQSMNVSWVVAILPQLDRSDFWAIWRTGTVSSLPGDTAPGNWCARNKTMKVLICPANPPDRGVSDTPLCYVVNAGMTASASDPAAPLPSNTPNLQAFGIFFNRGWCDENGSSVPEGNRPKQTLDYVVRHDGASCTLLLSENVLTFDPASGYGALSSSDPDYTSVRRAAPNPWNLSFMWANINSNPAGAAAMYSNTVNQDIQTPHARPSSVHRGGANVAFCDGHVSFLSEKIDSGVFTQLCAPNDVAAGAGSTSPPPPLKDGDY